VHAKNSVVFDGLVDIGKCNSGRRAVQGEAAGAAINRLMTTGLVSTLLAIIDEQTGPRAELLASTLRA
jgi:hypothetical protein